MKQLQRRKPLRSRRTLPLDSPLHRGHRPLQLCLFLFLRRSCSELRRAVDVPFPRSGKRERRLRALAISVSVVIVVRTLVPCRSLGRVFAQKELERGDGEALVGVGAAPGDGVGRPGVPPQPPAPELRQQAQRRAGRSGGLVRGSRSPQRRLRRPVEPVVAPLGVRALDVRDDVGADQPAQRLVSQPEAAHPEREELLGRDGAAVAQEHEGLGESQPERRVHRGGGGGGQEPGQVARQGSRRSRVRVARSDRCEERGQFPELAVRSRGLEGEDVEAGRVAAQLFLFLFLFLSFLSL